VVISEPDMAGWSACRAGAARSKTRDERACPSQAQNLRSAHRRPNASKFGRVSQEKENYAGARM
jgi:hypothetical protein